MMLDKQTQHALETGKTIDITTTGRKSGEARRIEIWFHNIDGHIYITGTPGHRDWYANLVAHPDFTFHFKEEMKADLPAQATPIVDEAARRRIFKQILKSLDRSDDIERWVADSPLVDVTFAG